MVGAAVVGGSVMFRRTRVEDVLVQKDARTRRQRPKHIHKHLFGIANGADCRLLVLRSTQSIGICRLLGRAVSKLGVGCGGGRRLTAWLGRGGLIFADALRRPRAARQSEFKKILLKSLILTLP